MLASETAQRTADQAEVRGMLKELQTEAILLVLPGLYAIGLALIGLVGQRPVLLPALLLYGLLFVVLALRGRCYLLAAWILVVGCMLLDLLIVIRGQLSSVLYLLTLPVGLATLLISLPAGVFLAMAGTILLCVQGTPLPDDPVLRVTTAIGLWSTVGLIGLTLRPLLTALQWSWIGYKHSRSLLEQARDYQVQLKQTLADLAEANAQLTRLNQLTQRLRRAAEDARSAKEQFVANVSHELRTPLNMIIGFSEMILQAPETYGRNIPPALLADLAVILRNSQHLSSLIDDVLDLSQIEAGKMALTKEWVSIAEIVEAAVTAVRPLFESKGLYLQIEIPDDLPPLFCDRTRIREVLLNLLSNAGRFTERGGVRVRALRDGDYVMISVADTGPGIAVEDQPKLFQPFQQLDGSVRRRYGGSGLGLAISKSFVELHQGTMWLESELGRGTTIFVKLPIEPPPGPIEGGVSRWFNPYSHYEDRPRRSMVPLLPLYPRLVVLETGDSLKKLLTRYMDRVEIVPVGSLEEAFEELNRVPAQALLVNTPSVSEALRDLGALRSLVQGVPIILCTVPGAHEAAGALGVADYLVKPVSRQALLDALDRLHLHQGTILIVDDEPEALRLFRRMLASAGRNYRVLRAANGHQALSVLREERPDVLLLDLVMPEMDGFQLLAAKAADAALRDIPVIAISALDPAGQPIVSNALAVTQRDGLTMWQLVQCIEALTRVLAPTSPVADPMRLKGFRDERACVETPPPQGSGPIALAEG